MADNKLFKSGVEILAGTFLLKVTKDKLQAIILPKKGETSLSADPTNSPVDINTLHNEMNSYGVVFGLLAEAETLDRGMGGEAFCVARGQPAINGEDAAIKMHVRPVIVRTPKQKNSKLDTVDYRELGNIVNVTKSKLLLEKVSATKGEAGRDILGNILAPKPGKDRKLKIGKGVYLSQDEAKVFATLTGKFVMVDNKPFVFTEHTITDNIDLSTGNIAFGGTMLTINGEVMSGFKVKCRGDINIGKGVNGALVMAGGNLSIRGGIVGSNTRLRAKGNVDIDFMEGGQIEVGADLIIQDFVVQSKAQVNGNMTALTGKGTIIGGRYEIGGSMYVKELGSEAEILTEISVGIVPALQIQKQKLDDKLELWSNRLNEVIKNISGLEKMQKNTRGRLPEDKATLLKKYKNAMPKVTTKIVTLTEQKKKLTKKLEQMSCQTIYVYDKIFSGVTVTIGLAERMITIEEEQVVIYLDQTFRQIFIRKMTKKELAGDFRLP